MGYLDSYQFIFYISVENGLDVLLQIYFFLKEVRYICKYLER